MIFILILYFFVCPIFSMEDQINLVDNNPLRNLYFFTVQEQTAENCINVPINLFGDKHPDLLAYDGEKFKIKKSYGKNDKKYVGILSNLNNSLCDPDTLIFFEKDIKKDNEWNKQRKKDGYSAKQIPKKYNVAYQPKEEIQRRFAKINYQYENFILKRLKKLLMTDKKAVIIYFPSIKMIHETLQDKQLNSFFRDESMLQWLNDNCNTIMKMPNAIQHKITGDFLVIMRENYAKNNAPSEAKKFDTLMQNTYNTAIKNAQEEYCKSITICKGYFCLSMIVCMLLVASDTGINIVNNYTDNVVSMILPYKFIGLLLGAINVWVFLYPYKEYDSLAQEFSEIKNNKAD